MHGFVKNGIRCALMVPLVLGPPSGAAMAQEGGSSEEFRDVRLLFHLVQADGFTDEDPEIADVVAEMRKQFNFRGYRLLSTLVQNIVLERPPGSSRLEGSGTQRIAVGDSAGVVLALGVEAGARRGSPTVRIEVSLTSVVPWNIRNHARTDPVERYLQASVTIRDGQKVVLGSTQVSAEEPRLFLVLTPSFVPEG